MPLHIALVLGQRELWSYLLVSDIPLLLPPCEPNERKLPCVDGSLLNVMLRQHRWECSNRTRTAAVIAPVTDHS